MRRVCVGVSILLLAAACGPSPSASPGAPGAPGAATATAKLGVRPAGDTEIQPDLSQVPPDLQKVYAHIDENIDEHVHLQLG
jgi:hypothetical protein